MTAVFARTGVLRVFKAGVVEGERIQLRALLIPQSSRHETHRSINDRHGSHFTTIEHEVPKTYLPGLENLNDAVIEAFLPPANQ